MQIKSCLNSKFLISSASLKPSIKHQLNYSSQQQSITVYSSRVSQSTSLVRITVCQDKLQCYTSKNISPNFSSLLLAWQKLQIMQRYKKGAISGKFLLSLKDIVYKITIHTHACELRTSTLASCFPWSRVLLMTPSRPCLALDVQSQHTDTKANRHNVSLASVSELRHANKAFCKDFTSCNFIHKTHGKHNRH